MCATRTRAPLSRERIIDTAVAFVDEHGLEELSMRKLGAELGVEAMSLYNHVANKDGIYDGMIDRVLASIQTPDIELDWREWIRATGASAIAVFTTHPWVVRLLMQRGNLGPSALAFMDLVLGVLLRAGFSRENAHHAWQMLSSHTMGYTFQSASVPPEVEARYERQLASIGEDYPNVLAVAPLMVECQFDVEYMFGLEIIIDGLASRLRR